MFAPVYLATPPPPISPTPIYPTRCTGDVEHPKLLLRAKFDQGNAADLRYGVGNGVVHPDDNAGFCAMHVTGPP